jgi:hypothetical protein
VKTRRGEKREADQRVERSKIRNENGKKKNHHYFDVFIVILLKPALCRDSCLFGHGLG